MRSFLSHKVDYLMAKIRWMGLLLGRTTENIYRLFLTKTESIIARGQEEALG
jgi:hypothetical protein